MQGVSKPGRPLAVLSAALVYTVIGGASVSAQMVYTVANNNDSGTGSLRKAITDLNAGLSGAFIEFSISSSTISPSTPLPAIQKSVHINDNNAFGIVLNGSSAGSCNGLAFQENTVQYSSIKGLTIQNFQQSGVLIAPTNANEKVDIENCDIKSCGGDGVTVSGGANHSIFGDTFLQYNSGYGLNFTSSSVQNVQMTDGALLHNHLGGVRFMGSTNQVSGVNIAYNGSAESSDDRGGVIVGGASAADNCRTLGCTLAGNTPWGLKRLSGSTGEARDNETYQNTSQGFKVLGAAPGITLTHFVIDTAHSQVLIGGTVTSTATTSVTVEFFVPADSPADNQGSANLSGADYSATTDGSGAATFFQTFSTSGSYEGADDDRLATHPYNFTIDNSDKIVATATVSLVGTSEFTSPAEATLPGDFNLNGSVDGADFLTWQANNGKTGAKYWEGDADFDGDVDNADKTIWQANFGHTP